jgi:hypothetical protein
VARRILDQPRHATIAATREKVFLRLLAVDMVTIAKVLVIPGTETDENLVPPGPDAMVRRPTSESAWDSIDGHVLTAYPNEVIGARNTRCAEKQNEQQRDKRVLLHKRFRGRRRTGE